MCSCHSTTAWSTFTDLLLVSYSTSSALITAWKPAGIRRKPRVRSVARMTVMIGCTTLRCVSAGSWVWSGSFGSSLSSFFDRRCLELLSSSLPDDLCPCCIPFEGSVLEADVSTRGVGEVLSDDTGEKSDSDGVDETHRR
ncbi:uncharacterized protein EDB93DRAFT_1182760 [Suillus bovinus]|uniref:uncharacterized protein n=1 Tax=Suillus bovinus TaxID=48563 RepID=UPI001B878A4F|nr:uncharacterized protein EDB93DRAFT_1182760 [Suillus bovinus]KAG2129207.1 hypothetical protein EDB93DRAFT_1182760 [Suillus bovinus]